MAAQSLFQTESFPLCDYMRCKCLNKCNNKYSRLDYLDYFNLKSTQDDSFSSLDYERNLTMGENKRRRFKILKILNNIATKSPCFLQKIKGNNFKLTLIKKFQVIFVIFFQKKDLLITSSAAMCSLSFL